MGRKRTSIVNALQQIKAKTLVIGIESDILFPLAEQQYLAKHIPGAAYLSIYSTYGHDGFLLEFEQIQDCITTFLLNNKTQIDANDKTLIDTNNNILINTNAN